VSKQFGSFKVLDSISEEIELGKLTAIFGNSGSSKSTLLSVISGLLRPTTGKVICEDIDIWKLNEKELDKFRFDNFSFIFQTHNLFNQLTSLQNIEIVLKWGTNFSRKEIRNKSIKILEELGLSHRLNTRPIYLSGGERQRVSVARAMVKNPKYLFADEPTSALDSKNGKKVIDMLKDQTKKGVAVILVTHDERLKSISDKIIKMEDGKITI
jgi:putative ABC transport system ATP-binding protein